MDTGSPLTIEHWILIASAVAVLVSPLIALSVSNKVSQWREARDRKYAVLRDLMATRRAKLDARHISALNLVELEFHARKNVRAAYKSYVKHLSTPFPTDASQESAFIVARNDLFNELLHEIAHDLGYRFDKSDLEKLGYNPTAYETNFENQMVNAELIRQILEGRRALPISNFIQEKSLFPPTPETKRIEKKPPED